MVKAGDLMGIPILDFLIIARDGYYSFHETYQDMGKVESYVADGQWGVFACGEEKLLSNLKTPVSDRLKFLQALENYWSRYLYLTKIFCARRFCVRIFMKVSMKIASSTRVGAIRTNIQYSIYRECINSSIACNITIL